MKRTLKSKDFRVLFCFFQVLAIPSTLSTTPVI